MKDYRVQQPDENDFQGDSERESKLFLAGYAWAVQNGAGSGYFEALYTYAGLNPFYRILALSHLMDAGGETAGTAVRLLGEAVERARGMETDENAAARAAVCAGAEMLGIYYEEKSGAGGDASKWYRTAADYADGDDRAFFLDLADKLG